MTSSFAKGTLVLCAMAGAAVPGWAVLGGSAESVVADQTKLAARRSVVENREYTVHELSRDDSTIVREYVSPAGKVFGVSWTGPTIPDLSQLLGSYNAEYQKSVRATAGHRRVAAVRNPDLVVENSGHTRAFNGRAYLKSLLPAGVTAETIQ